LAIRKSMSMSKKGIADAVLGVEVRIDRGQIWFFEGQRVCWVPKSVLIGNPELSQRRLMAEGYDISPVFIDELLIAMQH
jgi:hypothetical protein